MKRLLAALLVCLMPLVPGAAAAQDDVEQPQAAQPDAAEAEAGDTAIQELIRREISPETMALAKQLVALTGAGRAFDELLPNMADQAKNAFIRANPQMQLGIIEIVDRVALTLVPRRPLLDEYIARVWASGFTDAELQDLVAFYSTETGRKYAGLQTRLWTVEMAAAAEWSRQVSIELREKVTEELRSVLAAQREELQGSAPATGGDAAPAAGGEAAQAPGEAAPAQ